MSGKEYIIEFYQVGNSIKVTAADPVTLIEASIVGPVSASSDELQKLAIRKLEYVLSKRA